MTTVLTEPPLAATARAAALDHPRPADESSRIEDRFIICIASSWGRDPTSKHHIMRILSQRNDVLWVNYHGSRRPGLTCHDFRTIYDKLRRLTAGVQPINERMSQMTPFVIPGASGPTAAALNRRLVVSQIRRALRRLRRPHQAVQLWMFAPDVDYLAGAFDEECLVYYCVDEFSRFEGFDAQAIAAAERRLIDKADCVITTSAHLYDSKSALHPNVHLVRHGVDHAHFARAVGRDLPVPEPIRDIRGPIAGFVGVVLHWLDLALLEGVARALPDVSFVIVGQCLVDVSRLAALGNVHFVGQQPYDDLPAYAAAFDVGLIPFVRSPLTDNVNPIKLREYLAAGLPAVSTNLPEVRHFAPHVRIADDVSSFAAACRAAIADNAPAARSARSAAVADQDWPAVTSRIERIATGSRFLRRAEERTFRWRPFRRNNAEGSGSS